MIFFHMSQAIIIIAVILNILFRNKHSQITESFKTLTLANWVFNLCGIMSFILSFGLYGLITNNPNNFNDIGLCILFSSTCLTCIIIMYVQKMWLIKYDNKTLIFRNSFGIRKEYPINLIELIEKDNISILMCNGKIITKWELLIIDLLSEIELSKHLQHCQRED